MGGSPRPRGHLHGDLSSPGVPGPPQPHRDSGAKGNGRAEGPRASGHLQARTALVATVTSGRDRSTATPLTQMEDRREHSLQAAPVAQGQRPDGKTKSSENQEIVRPEVSEPGGEGMFLRPVDPRGPPARLQPPPRPPPDFIPIAAPPPQPLPSPGKRPVPTEPVRPGHGGGPGPGSRGLLATSPVSTMCHQQDNLLLELLIHSLLRAYEVPQAGPLLATRYPVVAQCLRDNPTHAESEEHPQVRGAIHERRRSKPPGVRGVLWPRVAPPPPLDTCPRGCALSSGDD
uniref:proline-rich protein HaeIII subfamily 1-like n=1 Tax=Nyctereutes procyonoides TaxID=34880 RepID=UPI002443CF65|nr:proline-rich protein HaeIII subfamily 1-like [Nyctereutes procyonoides]